MCITIYDICQSSFCLLLERGVGERGTVRTMENSKLSIVYVASPRLCVKALNAETRTRSAKWGRVAPVDSALALGLSAIFNAKALGRKAAKFEEPQRAPA